MGGTGRSPHVGPGCGEPPARFAQVLRKDLHVGEHRHEVRVAGPARHDVQVHVVDETGAGDPAEVPADVVALRRVGLCECGHCTLREAVQVKRLLVGEVAELTHMAERRDKQVAGGVRELVQERERTPAAVDDETLAVVTRRGVAEETAFLLVCARDVFETPGCPQLLRHRR